MKTTYLKIVKETERQSVFSLCVHVCVCMDKYLPPFPLSNKLGAKCSDKLFISIAADKRIGT